MGIKASLAKLAAATIVPKIYAEHKNAEKVQQRIFHHLIKKAKGTRFGNEHEFSGIHSHREFVHAVPVKDYEDLKHYMEMIAEGKPGVLWPGQPLYFCKSSGTTSGTKYIPLTKESIAAQIAAARNALLHYVHETGRANFFDKKMIFLQGSPELEKYGEIPVGRLSGIVYHHVPAYLNKNRMPSYAVNCIEDWEQKVEAIAKETLAQDMSLISGIPPWTIMYFEKLLELSKKSTVAEVFPSFELFVYGGVNYEPYRSKIEALIGFAIPSIETYPASEGFLAYQDSITSNGLLLNLNAGIFYEFIKADEYGKESAKRLTISEVELHVNYAVILNTNAGLWAYSIGDTVKFVSKNPYRIIVTGRIKHFISAFGEHVIAEEVEYALLQAAQKTNAPFTEFTVAPQVNPDAGLPFHEWFIEFTTPPDDLQQLAQLTDELMQQKNSYYRDLREGNILQQLQITSLPAGTFVTYMRQTGKLGGQNKVARLTNNRQIADALTNLAQQ
ncbi:MAG: GH3 auxin-responsive promoter family protein [Chitinophagales bacterium]